MRYEVKKLFKKIKKKLFKLKKTGKKNFMASESVEKY